MVYCLLLDLLPLVRGSGILSSDKKMKQEMDRCFWCGISCIVADRAEPEGCFQVFNLAVGLRSNLLLLDMSAGLLAGLRCR